MLENARQVNEVKNSLIKEVTSAIEDLKDKGSTHCTRKRVPASDGKSSTRFNEIK